MDTMLGGAAAAKVQGDTDAESVGALQDLLICHGARRPPPAAVVITATVGPTPVSDVVLYT